MILSRLVLFSHQAAEVENNEGILMKAHLIPSEVYRELCEAVSLGGNVTDSAMLTSFLLILFVPFLAKFLLTIVIAVGSESELCFSSTFT